MKITKRLLVLLITVSMLLSGSFVQAFAEEETVDSASVAVPETVSEEDSEDTKEVEAAKEKEAEEEAEAKEETVPAEEEASASAEETQKSSEPAEADEPDEKSKEAADNKDAETLASGKLTFECDEYTVTLEYGKKAGIPEGTVLDVREILEDSKDKKERKEYKEYYETCLGQIRSEKGEDAVDDLSFAKFYDITLRNGDKEIEPKDDVIVTFKYNKGAREVVENKNSSDTVSVVHLTESKKTGELEAELIAKKDIDLTLDKKELKEVGFTTDSFSVYGIVETTTLEKVIKASDGKSYKITVNFDENSGIPAGSELKVEEVPDEDYEEYLTSAAEVIGTDIHRISYGKLFDISIVKDGKEYQPDDSVKVTVELLDAKKVDDVKVVHFEDKDNAQELSADTDGSTVLFETEGFSVFSFIDLTLIQNAVDAEFGSTYEDKIYENDDIVVSGHMPGDAIVEANPATVKIKGVDVFVAYDIKIYAGPVTKSLGIEWQPDGDPLTVKVKSDALEGRKTVSVFHMHDESSEPEFVTSVDVEDSSVTFDAESFSIYPIGEGDNARIGYRFWYFNGSSGKYEEITTQYFRYKDVQGQGRMIYEPTIPGVEQSDLTTIFEGWHKGTVNDGEADLEDQAVTVADLNAELQSKAKTDYVEGTIVDVIAKLKSAYYITYVDVNPSNVLGTDLVVKEESGTTYFSIKNGMKPTKYEEDLKGWKLIDQASDPDATLYEAGLLYPITENITLAPVIENGYWLIFDDNDMIDDGTGKMVSGGASYTPPAFYMNNETEQQKTVQPPDPEWVGYDFAGWYEDEACTTPFTFGGVLTADTTVHAKWVPSASSYTVIIWKQPTDPDKTDPKDYDFDQSFTIGVDSNKELDGSIKTGDLVYLDSQYTKIYGEDGTSSDTDKQYFIYNQELTDQYTIVKANGSSVLNVYYDRVPMTISFYTWGNGYVYTETTAENGTQYGIVNGEYVQLTKKTGEEEVYTYTYSPAYVAETSTTSSNYTRYGIVNKEYKELTAVPSYSFNYNPFIETTGTTGTQYALIDGEYVQLNRVAKYYPASGYSYTQSTNDNDNNPQKFGIYNSGIIPVYYGTDWRRNPGWYRTENNILGYIYYSDPYSGDRFTRNDATSSTEEYSGTTYYINGNSFNTTERGTAYGRAGTNNNYTYFPLREEYIWQYENENGVMITLPASAKRYAQSGSGTAYDGTRYTRGGSNWWNYSYTATNDQTTGLYGVDNRGGHVQLNRSASPDAYTYYYGDKVYAGTRYYAPNNNPVDYSGTIYTLDNGVYHVTTEGSATEPRYGQDENGAFRLLTASVSHPQLWTYTDPATGKSVTYSGTRYTRSNNQQNSWQLYKQFAGVYGATFEQYGYTWPTNYNWYETGYGTGGNANASYSYPAGTTGGTRMTLKTTFEPLDGDLSPVYYGGNATTGGKYISFLTENLDGTYTEADRIYLGNSNGNTSFNINDKYTGFHASQYRVNGSGSWNNVGPKNPSTGTYGNSVSFSNYLEVRFDRSDYQLVFFPDPDTNAEPITYSIPYGADLSGYANQSPGQKMGHYFLGWFADDAHSSQFIFNTTMPSHNVSVFGYWRMERIRAVFVPGADNVYIDPSQSLSFRVGYDERIGGSFLESATRAGYVLDGWYTDPNFTNKFLFSTPVNSNTEGVDMTYQTSPRWASTRESYGDNNETNSNVRGILVLYAKWNVNTSEKGVNVVYDAGTAGLYDGMGNLSTIIPVDPNLYQDGSSVVVGVGPNGYSDLYIFDGWEVVDSNGHVVTVDGVDKFLPGMTFNVDSISNDDAFDVLYDDNDDVILKTIKLRACYVKSEEAAARYTTITYDGNTLTDSIYPSGTQDLHGKTSDGSEKLSVTVDTKVNDPIILKNEEDFYLDGYTLVGWSYFEGTYDQQIAAANAWNAEHPDDKVDVKFEPAQSVAADDLTQNPVNDDSNILYAMWQPKTYKVTVKQVVEPGVAAAHSNNERFTYSYRSGVENTLTSAPMKSLTLDGAASETYTNLTADESVKYQYYGRLGHVFSITPPAIPENADYAVRVNATVMRDDGTLEPLDPNNLGNYEIRGDVEITFTYSLKVLVKLEKRSMSDNQPLNGSIFRLTPVQWNANTQRWEAVGTTTFTYDMTSVSSMEARLQEGVYRVEEIQAPEDYAMMGEPLLLTVRRNEAFLIRTTTGGTVNENVAKITGADNHTLTVYDRPIRTIAIKKKVLGIDLDPTGYTFSVRLTLEDSPMRNYDTVGEGLPADTTNSSGIIEFKLKDDEQKVLRVPWGAVIQIEESESAQFNISTESAEGVPDIDTDNSRIYKCNVQEDDTITFTNKNIPLTVKKEVTGEFGDRTKSFAFKIGGLTAGKLYRMTVAGTQVTKTASADGTISFELKHGQTMLIPLIELGTYTVTETEVDGYKASVTVNGGDPELISSKSIRLINETELAFINYHPPVAPTNVATRAIPFMIILGIGLLLIVIAKNSRRQLKEDE